MAATKIAQVRRLMANDERVGMGFNSASGLAVGTPFDLDAVDVEADPNAPGQEVFSTITRVESHEQLASSMGLAVEAQGRYGFFSADLKAQFAESTQYNSTSTFLIAKVIVQNPFERGTTFRLTDDAKALLRTQQDVFKTAFGDSFVRGIQTGGEFYAVIRLTSISTSTQNELAVELQAEYNGLVAGGSFEGKFRKANESSSTRSEFSAMMFQRAGVGQEISPTAEIADVLARVKAFPTIVATKPVAYEIEVATYDTLPLPLPTPEEQESLRFALQDASEKRLRYIQARNDLEFARQHPEFFERLPPDDVLAAAIAAYTKLINAVMSHGIDLSTGRMDPPRVFDPSALTPPLVEPAPIPLPRVTTPPATTFRLPDLASVDFRALVDMLLCLGHQGPLAGCLDGTAFPGPDGEIVPSSLDRDVAEFLDMAVNGALEVKWIPADPVDMVTAAGGPTTFSIQSQFPAPGAEVRSDSEVIVQILAVPE